MKIGKVYSLVVEWIIGKDPAGKRLGPGARGFLLLFPLFSLGVALSMLFVNVYFWQVKEDLVLIGLFNLIQFVTLPIAFTFAGFLANLKRDRLFCLRIGIILHIIFFTLVLWLRTEALTYILPLGGLLGAGAGFFFLAINVLVYDLTDNTSVERFNGLSGLVVGTANMIAPFISGWLTSKLPGLSGYYVIFGLSLGLFVLVLALSGRLWQRPLAKHYYLLRALFYPGFFRIALASFLTGLRAGTFPFLIGLLVFIEGNEFTLGLYSTAMAAISLVASFVGARLINKDNRSLWIVISGLLLTLAPLIVGWQLSLVSLVVFGAAESIGTPWYALPFQARTFRVIDKNPAGADARVEFLVGREIPLNIGRIISISLLLWMSQGTLKETEVSSFMWVITPLGVLLSLSILGMRD